MASKKAVAVESGLDDAAIAVLRQQLSDGKAPRVRFVNGQVSEAGTGVVTRIGDPVVDGPEFLTVRIKVSGVADELPFAPAELAVGRRPVPPPEPVVKPRVRRPARPKAPVAVPARPVAVVADPPRPPAEPSRRPTETAQTTPEPTKARRRKPDDAPKVTLSIVSAGSTWSITATRGAKNLVKSAPVAPGVITAIAGLLDHAGISEAVFAINDKARVEAQARAQQLRAELAEVEAILAAQQAPK